MSSIQMVGADSYLVDGQNYNTESLIMMLQMNKVNNLDKMLMDQANQIKARNDVMREANDFLADMRGRKAADKDQGLPPGYANFCAKHGINIPKPNPSHEEEAAEWDANIEALKGFQDAQSSSSQMDMIRMQQIMNKRNQSFETMTNTVSKEAKTMDSIIGNLR